MRGGRPIPPTALIDAVRARVAPFFPTWDTARIEELVRQMAAVEWRYLSGCCSDTRPAHPPTANPDPDESITPRPHD